MVTIYLTTLILALCEWGIEYDYKKAFFWRFRSKFFKVWALPQGIGLYTNITSFILTAASFTWRTTHLFKRRRVLSATYSFVFWDGKIMPESLAAGKFLRKAEKCIGVCTVQLISLWIQLGRRQHQRRNGPELKRNWENDEQWQESCHRTSTWTRTGSVADPSHFGVDPDPDP